MSDDGKKIPEIIPEILIEPLDSEAPEREVAEEFPTVIPEIAPTPIEEPVPEPEPEPETEPETETGDIPPLSAAEIAPEFQDEPEPEPEPDALVLDSDLDVPTGDTLVFEDPFEETLSSQEPKKDEEATQPAGGLHIGPEFETDFEPETESVSKAPVEQASSGDPNEPDELSPDEDSDEYMEIDETPASGLSALILDEAPPAPGPAPFSETDDRFESSPDELPESDSSTVPDITPEPTVQPEAPDTSDADSLPADAVPADSDEDTGDDFEIIDDTPASGLDGLLIDDAPAPPDLPSDQVAGQAFEMFPDDDDEPAVVWKKPPVEPDTTTGSIPEDVSDSDSEESAEDGAPAPEQPDSGQFETPPPPIPQDTPPPVSEPASSQRESSPLPEDEEPEEETPTASAPVPPAGQTEPPETDESHHEVTPAFDTEPEEEEPDLPPDEPVIDDNFAELIEKGWVISEPDSKCSFALSIGPELYLIQGGKLQQVDNIRDLDEHITYIADYPTAPGPQSTIIDGPAKFAPVLLRKKLQEDGELTDEYTLVTFQQQKISAQRTRISFELMPNASYTGQMNNAVRTKKGYLLHNTTSFLAGLLMGSKAKKGAAFAMHLPGHIITLAGKNGKIYFARRYALAGEDEFSLRSGMANMHQDLVGLNTRGELEIPNIEWIEGLSHELLWPDIRFDLPIERRPVAPLEMDGERWWTAVPSVLEKASASACLGPKADIRLLPFVGLEKWIWGFLGLAGAGLLVAAVMMNMAAGELHTETSKLELDNRYLNEELNNEIKSVQAVSRTEKDFQEVKEVAKKINFAGSVPPIATIWQELADIKPTQCRLSSLQADYEEKGVKVGLTGSLSTGILRTQEVFTDFLTALESAGWNVDSKSVVLDVNDNTFSMSLTKNYKGS